jgi:hypothetical protein
MANGGPPNLADFLRARIEEALDLAADVERREVERGVDAADGTRRLATLVKAQAQARLEIVRQEEAQLDATGATDTLRWLATPYVDHPDYRDEWRP